MVNNCHTTYVTSNVDLRVAMGMELLLIMCPTFVCIHRLFVARRTEEAISSDEPLLAWNCATCPNTAWIENVRCFRHSKSPLAIVTNCCRTGSYEWGIC